jgi:hypothetical protein
MNIRDDQTTGPKQKADRFPLDYATWYARLAAPGSRIGLAQFAPHPMVSLDVAVHLAKSAELERRIA